MQTLWLEEIMQAAVDVFANAGAAIVGGHTSLGAELSIGFSVTGIVGDRTLTSDGARTGDAIILTRPIGSGTLLAGEMEGSARGVDVAACLSIMATPQGDAAAILAPNAHAMTDVTGFGLAGHLKQMADASGLSSRLNLDAVPVYSGASALAEGGLRSSIYDANRADIQIDVPDTAAGVLLFDPQTSGGFLAAVDPADAGRLVENLAAKGHRSAVIGRFDRQRDVSVTVA